MSVAALLQPNVPIPTYRMGFGAAPLDPQSIIAWEYITSWTHTDGIERLRVLSTHSKVGRPAEMQHVDAGTATYLVDNRDGAFNPQNTAGLYYPYVKNGVLFQELHTWAGTTYPVFTGFVDDFDLREDELGNPQVQISCTDAFKVLQLDALEASPWAVEVRKDVSANIAAGHNTAWLGLGNASSANVMSDSGGQGWDGDFQNGPTLGIPSLIAGDTGTAMDCAHSADQRASLPYKNLLTQWPFTVEFVLRVFPNRSDIKGLIVAFDGPSLSTQGLQAWIGTEGRLYCLLSNPYPAALTGRRSTLTIDDGAVHHVAIVMSSSTDLKLWINGSDFTDGSYGVAASMTFPTNLLTGIGIGNFPAVSYGDFGINAGTGVDPVTGKTVQGGMQSVVFYDGLALSPTRIQAHAVAAVNGWGTVGAGSRVHKVLDVLGWPSADRAIDAGSAMVGNDISGATPLEYLQLIADTEGGRFFIGPDGFPTFHGRLRPLVVSRSTTPQATFDDAGTAGTIPYIAPFEPRLDDLDLWYRASVARVGGNPQIVDATPGSTLTRMQQKSGLLMTEDRDARAMAQYDVSVGKVQRPRVATLTFQPQASPTLGWPAALGLVQGDRITVNRTFEGTPTWSADWIVEGIERVWESASTFLTIHLSLSPADPARYFILGVSEIGSSDLLFW